MRKIHSRRGFTLVELIVVLVILAVLAAMLVPALTGYIKRANREKDMQMAASYRTAAQAVLTELYGRGEWVGADRHGNSTNKNATSYAWKFDYGNAVMDLVGDPAGHPYLLYVQCGRYPMYGDPASSDCTAETEAYAYTCYRLYYQASKDSALIVIDNYGVCTAEEYAERPAEWRTRDYVPNPNGGDVIKTVVYCIELGPNSNPGAVLQQIEKGTYET